MCKKSWLNEIIKTIWILSCDKKYYLPLKSTNSLKSSPFKSSVGILFNGSYSWACIDFKYLFKLKYRGKDFCQNVHLKFDLNAISFILLKNEV